MSLDAALGIASSGLLSVQRALAQASANVGNANTAGYTAKTLAPQAQALDGMAAGVLPGEAQRAVDQALVGQIGSSTAGQAAAALRERLLRSVEDAYGSVSGSEGVSNLADDVTALRNAFITLKASAADPGAQRAAVAAAGKVASDFNAVGKAIGTARQAAQDEIVSQVSAANAALRRIGGLTRQIQQAMAAGRGTADLQDQRDQAVQSLSASLAVRAVPQSDGGLLLLSGSVVLPTDPDRDVLATQAATISPGAWYGGAGTLPGITLGGVDVTRQLAGGTLGAAIQLRDDTLPRMQAESDIAAAQLAWRFDQQGLTLFNATGSGAVPDMTQPYTAGGQLGFATLMQVNPAVSASPSSVRDGTRSVSTLSGGVTNFVPNPAGGPTGFTTLVNNVVTYTFGSEAATGTAWMPSATSGLGPDGTLVSAFNAPATVQDLTVTVLTVQAGERAQATAEKEMAGSLLATLQQRFTAQSGVSVDAEMTAMVRLQQAYSANAKVMSTVQQMWDALLGAVQ